MKTCRGVHGSENWLRHQMEISGQLHASADIYIYIYCMEGWVGPTAGLNSVKRKFLSLSGIKHDPPVDRPHSQVTILTQLPRLADTFQLWTRLLEAPLIFA
jgi:hypothetical protein